MAQDEHDRHMETYEVHQKAMRRGSMSALFTVDEAVNSVAPEDVVSDEVYQGLRAAMAMLILRWLAVAVRCVRRPIERRDHSARPVRLSV